MRFIMVTASPTGMLTWCGASTPSPADALAAAEGLAEGLARCAAAVTAAEHATRSAHPASHLLRRIDASLGPTVIAAGLNSTLALT